MEAATVEPKSVTKTVVFVAKCHNLSLTKVQPRFESRDQNNRVVSELVERVAVNFEKGRAEIYGESETTFVPDRRPVRDKEGFVIVDPATREPLMEDYEREVTVHRTHVNSEVLPVPFDELIAWLQAHPLLNQATNSGFWQEGVSPDEPRPTVAEQTTAISRAAIKGDVARIQEIIAEEEANHNRPAVLATARDTIETLQEDDAE
jgi:hypothetical protein